MAASPSSTGNLQAKRASPATCCGDGTKTRLGASEAAIAKWSPTMRDDFPLTVALTCGLTAAGAALVLISTPLSVPLFLVAGGALGVSIGELVRS